MEIEHRQNRTITWVIYRGDTYGFVQCHYCGTTGEDPYGSPGAECPECKGTKVLDADGFPYNGLVPEKARKEA